MEPKFVYGSNNEQLISNLRFALATQTFYGTLKEARSEIKSVEDFKGERQWQLWMEIPACLVEQTTMWCNGFANCYDWTRKSLHSLLVSPYDK